MVAGDNTIKVGDLGLARDVYLTNHYHANSRGPLPIRWMAPESIFDRHFGFYRAIFGVFHAEAENFDSIM